MSDKAAQDADYVRRLESLLWRAEAALTLAGPHAFAPIKEQALHLAGEIRALRIDGPGVERTDGD